MSSLGGILQQRELRAQPLDRLHGLVDAEGGLREPDDLRLVAHGDLVDRVRTVDELDVVGGLAGSALHLLVAFVTDEQDVVVVAGEALRLLMHLRHQGARGIDGAQAAFGGGGVHRRGDTVRREHEHRALGYLVGLLDEDDTSLGEGLDHVPVVDDLLADVDRGTMLLECLLHRFDGPVDTGAVPARLGEQDALAGSR